MIATVKRPAGGGQQRQAPGGDRPARRLADLPLEDGRPPRDLPGLGGDRRLHQVTDDWRGIPVEYYVPPGTDEATARRSFGDTPKILEFFSQATGHPYPYAKYAQTTVVDYMWGGMENISATTQTASTLHDARAEVDSPSEGLVAHETAHQWFGDLLTCEDWSNAWLNEGFADYFTALYARSAHGEDAFAVEIDDLRRAYLREAERDYRRPIVEKRYADPIDMFDRHAYAKGALVLHMIHHLLGEEGWAKGIHAYVERYAAQTVTTADLQNTLETATGVALGPLFDGYVYGAGHPELKVKWDYRPETRQVHLEIRQTQKLDAHDGLFAFPLDVALVGERETVARRVQVAARDFQDLYIESDERPRTVVLDPEGWILKTVDFAKPAAEWAVQLTAAKPLAAKLEAIRALGDLGGDEAVAALGRALRDEPFYAARRGGREGAGRHQEGPRPGGPARRARRQGQPRALDRPRCARRLPRARRADPDPQAGPGDGRQLRRARLGGRRARRVREPPRRRSLPLLVAALAQESFREAVRGTAIKALAQVDPARAWDHAVRLAKYGAPIDSRADALEALVTIAKHDRHRRDEVRKILEGYLDDPYYSLREDAYRRLGELGDPAAIPAIEHRARLEPDGRQQRNAEKAVERIRNSEAKGREDQALRDRVEQLERETEVLKEQLRQGEKKGGGGRLPGCTPRRAAFSTRSASSAARALARQLPARPPAPGGRARRELPAGPGSSRPSGSRRTGRQGGQPEAAARPSPRTGRARRAPPPAGSPADRPDAGSPPGRRAERPVRSSIS